MPTPTAAGVVAVIPPHPPFLAVVLRLAAVAVVRPRYVATSAPTPAAAAAAAAAACLTGPRAPGRL